MKSHWGGTLATLLTETEKLEPQLAWALHLAAARRMDLLILQRFEANDDRVEEYSLSESGEQESPARVREIVAAIGRYPGARAGAHLENVNGTQVVEPHIVHVRLKGLHFKDLRSLRHLVLDQLRTSDTRLLTLTRILMDEDSSTELVQESRLFLRYISCPVVIRQGPVSLDPCKRLLAVASQQRSDRATLLLGLDLAEAGQDPLTAALVNPPVGPLAQQVGERRLDRLLQKFLGPDAKTVDRRVVVDANIPSGFRQVWEEGDFDLLVLGSERNQTHLKAAFNLGKNIPKAVLITASPFAGKFLEIIEDGIKRLVPQIDREGRIALVDRVQSSAAWNFDFAALMVLSTMIAAMGLIQNSGAVVIGAMLVAPIMTPLLGIGLAVEQGNAALARMSMKSLGLGIVVSLLGGFLVGISTLGFVEPSREMLGRGGPGLIDLFVAFVSGLAAAYAYSRPNLIAALPGVAIAAALVPPIATAGLALSLGDFGLALGAFLLFAINMVTIVLASMTSLWAVGIRTPGKRAMWLRWVGSGIIASVLCLAIFLSVQDRELQLAEEMPSGLVDSVRSMLGSDFEFESLAVAYDELGAQLHVTVVGAKPAPPKLATQVRILASDYYRQPVRVRLLTRIETEVPAGGATERGTE